jgi:dihydroorotate dehydrogenase
MYKSIIRPLLFLISPEKVHYLVSFSLKVILRIPLIPYLLKTSFLVKNKGLEREIAGIKFPNPVGLAAGFDKNATLYKEFSNFGFGFIEIGTVTPLAQAGNEKPRLFRLPKDKSLINRMGFNNKGLLSAINRLKGKRNIIVGGNIGKNTLTPNENAVSDYLECFKGLYDVVDYFVVNVSCPNVSNLSKLQDQDSLEKILRELIQERENKAIKKPIFLKISPDLNLKQVDETLEIVEKTCIEGLVVSNTTVLRENLKTATEKVNSIGKGGLSGLPIRERSTEMIKYVRSKNKNLPIIGVGGIMTAEDAIEKLNAGASLIQVYTGFIYEGPGIVKEINKSILKTIVN